MDVKSALERAKIAARKGANFSTRSIIRQIIEHDPCNEEALLLFAEVAQKKEDAIYCLEQIIKLNPNNQVAHQKLEKLQPSNSTSCFAQGPLQEIMKEKIARSGFPKVHEGEEIRKQEEETWPKVPETMQEDLVPCPYCKLTQEAAPLCKFCGRDLLSPEDAAKEPQRETISSSASRGELYEEPTSKTPLSTLDSMDGHEFENLVEQLLTKMGFRIHGRKGAADGGIDMIAQKDDPITGGKFIIQCKRFSSPVGLPFIRDLFGVVHDERANKGVLITNSTFTKEASRFAEDKPLELIDGSKLQELLVEYDLVDEALTTQQVKIPPGVQLVYSRLNKPLKEIFEESKRVESGLVFVPRRQVNSNRWRKAILELNTHLMDEIKTIICLGNSIVELVNKHEPSPEELALLRLYLQEILSIARTILEDQKQATALIPPESFSKAHEKYLRVFGELFRGLSSFNQFFQDLAEGNFSRVHEGTAELALVFNLPSLDDALKELNRAQSGCFIASACYGRETDFRVAELKRFRDRFLMRTQLGVKLVRFYYRWSPPLAKVIQKKSFARFFVRAALFPIVMFVTQINRSRWIQARSWNGTRKERVQC